MPDYKEWVDSLRAFFRREGYDAYTGERPELGNGWQLVVPMSDGSSMSVICGRYINELEVAIFVNPDDSGEMMQLPNGDTVLAGLTPGEVVNLFFTYEKKHEPVEPKDLYSKLEG